MRGHECKLSGVNWVTVWFNVGLKISCASLISPKITQVLCPDITTGASRHAESEPRRDKQHKEQWPWESIFLLGD
jgi:hypothetical protein